MVHVVSLMIITENLKHFPENVVEPHGLEVKTADSFVADTIDLQPGKSIKALARMRSRFNKPALDAEQLLLLYESRGFYETADTLRPFVDQL